MAPLTILTFFRIERAIVTTYRRSLPVRAAFQGILLRPPPSAQEVAVSNSPACPSGCHRTGSYCLPPPPKRGSPLYFLQVLFDERSQVGHRGERVAHLEESGVRLTSSSRNFIQRAFHVYSGAAQADLTVVGKEDRRGAHHHLRFEVAVGKDDIGVLPAQLQRQF